MDDTASIEAKVLDIIAAQAEVDRSTVTPATELDALSLDSVDFVEVIFSVEDAFDISIPYNANEADAAGASFKTAGDIVKAVTDLVNKQK
jgi:acyl carrier protein